MAIADLDNDGDLDFVIQNYAQPASILISRGATGHWLQLRLRGTRSHGDAIGARVRVQAAGTNQWRSVLCGGAYLSCQSRTLHYGLGTAAQVDEVEIHWPSGHTQLLRDLPADQILDVVEGETPGFAGAPQFHLDSGE